MSFFISEKSVPEGISAITDLILFSQALDLSRKRWHVISGSGSQSSEYDIIKELAKKTIEFADKKIKEELEG